MDSTHKHSKGWSYALIPSLAGVIAVLWAAGVTGLSLTLAAAVAVLSTASGLYLSRRDQQYWIKEIQDKEQRLLQKQQQELRQFLDGLGQMETEVTSLWARQIETGRGISVVVN